MHGLVRWIRTQPPALVSGAVVSVVGLLGVWLYLLGVKDTYAVDDWLFWPLARIYGWVLLQNAAWLLFGHAILLRVFRERELPFLETVVQSLALGVAGSAYLLYVAGALRLFGQVFAPLFAVAMIAVGLPDARRLWTAHLRARAERGAAGPWLTLLVAIGGVCVGIVYLGAFTPEAINYDASWSHLSIAQDYAREGAIVAFPADYYRALPHLASLLQSWSFMVPGLSPAQHWMLALHQEFGLFVWTLAGVGAASRWLCDDQQLRGSWVGFFLFPIIFVYDHNLGGASDHIAAFFALPILLATARLWERFEPRRAALVGGLLGVLLITKYQAVYLIAPIGGLFGIRWLWLVVRSLRARGDAGLTLQKLGLVAGALGGSLALAAAPHFLKNAIFYHNPVYPFMQRVFPSRPTLPNAAFLFENTFTDINWVPKGTFFVRLWHALKLTQTFSFEPHYSFTKNFPVFGSLFTLLLPTLPFLKHRGRVALGALLGFGGLFTWAYTFNVDRNLQVLMPIMVAVTCALIVNAVRTSRLALLGIVPVVGMQIVWGGDALFYSSFERLHSAMDLIRSGYEGRAKGRFDQYRAQYVALHEALPPQATVLLHMTHINLGIDRRVYLDWTGFQGLIDLTGLRTPRELFDYYRRLGITHLVFVPGERPASSVQEEVLYDTLVHDYASEQKNVSGFHVLSLATQAPPREAPYRVATIGVAGYGSGVFAVERMATSTFLLDPKLRRYPKPDAPLPLNAEQATQAELDAVVVGSGANIPAHLRGFVEHNFSQLLGVSGHYTVYGKRQPR